MSAKLHKRYGADYTVVVGATADEIAAALADSPETAGRLDPGRALQHRPRRDRGRRAGSARVTARRCGRARCAGATWTSPNRSSPPSPPASSTPGCTGRSRSSTRSSTSAITELLDEWASRGGSEYEAVQLIGERWAPRSTELRDIFLRNHVPTGFYDARHATRPGPAGLTRSDRSGAAGRGAAVPPGPAGADQPECDPDRGGVRPAGLGAERTAVRRGGDRGRPGRA